MDTPCRMANLGCGQQHHPDWINIDLVASSPEVMAHDLSQGIPFDDHSLDVVYHSHVLEHLTPEDGRAFLGECHRVLKTDGVLRIVVPDLEQIARCYLAALETAWESDRKEDFRYNWFKLELLDQMTRTESGGQMGRTMQECPPEHIDFLCSRMGGEFLSLHEPSAASDPPVEKPRKSMWQRLQRETAQVRDRFVRSLIKRLYGRDQARQWQTALFRSRGEIHQWMYDRYSLRSLLEQLGFEDIQIKACESSSIPDFASYQLDAINHQPRKPDSIFVEARKRSRQAMAA